MATSFNPVSTSGIGFKLEHYVQASYLISLLVKTPVHFESDMEIVELKFQAKQVADTDDLLVYLEGADGKTTYYLQSKSGLEINKNKTFEDLIDSQWKDFNKEGFDKKRDRFIVTTNVLTKTDAVDGLLVLEWARGSKDWPDFQQKIQYNNQKASKLQHFINAIHKANGGPADHEQVWAFLCTIYIKVYDYTENGSKDIQTLQWFIQPFLRPGHRPEDALRKIIEYVETRNQHGATLTAENVDPAIKGYFDLTQSPHITAEVRELFQKSSGIVKHGIRHDIDGYHLDRSGVFTQIEEALAGQPIVIISGEGGIGKSAIAKDFLGHLFSGENAYLAFKADTLDQPSLARSLSEIGVHRDFSTILSQWVLMPRLLIYIDGFEKLYESSHREALEELLANVKTVSRVRIIATCRDYAIETLRKKYRIGKEEMGIVPLSSLSDWELERIATQKSALRPLIENPRLRKLVELPLYLDLASQIVDSLDNKREINEADFKNALWERLIEKKGWGSLGQSRRRVAVFSTLVLKRAREKVPFVQADDPSEIDTIAGLELDGLLIKHPAMDAYAPAHDIFEDMVVVRHLQECFEHKVNALSFLASIDSNPVFRRGIRLWIQTLIDDHPVEANAFLTDILPHHTASDSLVDEILVGILGAKEPYELLNRTKSVLLADNGSLFLKIFRLLKVAYVKPYTGEDPERKVTTTGQGWSALLQIMDENYAAQRKLFDAILVDLLRHWTFQFGPDDPLPEQGNIVAKYCFELLREQSGNYRSRDKQGVLATLFSVAPLAEQGIRDLLLAAIDSKKTDKELGPFPASFYEDLFKMILVDTVKCVGLYKILPELIMDIARMEWYSDRILENHESDYLEASFGLVSYPYKYFSASAYQTPFRYWFRYHSALATDFVLEICNRSLTFYRQSEYVKTGGIEDIDLRLSDGSDIRQSANGSLWAAYRGLGSSPYLIQSILMAYEAHLLERIDQLSPDYFEHLLRKSHSVLITGVLASIAMAYPLVFHDKVIVLFTLRELFGFDIGRYSGEMTASHHTEIGNEYYFVHERHLANALKHRKTNLEFLVRQLQLYFPDTVNHVIDVHLAVVTANDPSWKLALTRMDLRHTTPSFNEERTQVIFTPNPLPEDLQEYVEEGRDDQGQYMDYISTVMWASRAFRDENEQAVSFEEWEKRANLIKTEEFKRNQPHGDISKSVSAIGLRDFYDRLDSGQLKMAAEDITADLETTVNQLKAGYFGSAHDVFYKADFSVLPILLQKELSSFVSGEYIMQTILAFLVLLPTDDKKDLIMGIRRHLWAIDQAFAEQCFQLSLKLAKNQRVNQEIYQLRYQYKDDDLIREVDKILHRVINAPAINLPSINLAIDGRKWILWGLALVPDELLLSTYKNYLQQLIVGLGLLSDLDDYRQDDIVRGFKGLLTDLLMANADKNAQEILISLLYVEKTQFKFVLDCLEELIAKGHDSRYPPNLWTHLNTLLSYAVQVSGKVGFFRVLLLASLRNPYRCHKLPEQSPGRAVHQWLIAEGSADSNLIDAVFRLLAGVGSVYQPDSLSWLMKGMPDRAAYGRVLIIDDSYMETYIQQLYEHHRGHISRNRDQMDYFILLLNVLIERGSTLAFRIRDDII